MSDPFTEHLRACLVAVRGGAHGRGFGTGFFIADDLILTCQHVVDGAARVQVRFAGITSSATVQPLQLAAVADVALLKTEPGTAPAPRCARLGSLFALHDEVRTRGFPVREGAPHEEQVTGRIEDTEFQHPREPWKSGARLIKFKEGQIKPGLSGAPLVHESTRRVIGVVTSTRGGDRALGGVAVPISLVLNGNPAIREAQSAIAWSSTPWRDIPGAEGPFLERYLDPRMPFFGREAKLRELDEWLESPYQLGILVAPSGMGKSLLLARWYEHVRAAARRAARDIRIQLVPISLHSGHVHREQVLFSLERAVTMLRGESFLERDPDLKTFNFAAAIREGLRRPAPPGAQCVLLVDALDETVGWEIRDSLFPREVGAGIHILLTARALSDTDVQGWRKRVGWSEPVAVQEFSLEPLTPAELREAVVSWWGLQAGPAEQYAQRLWELTRGDVLVLGLYFTQYTRETLTSPDQLGGSSAGLEGFFEAWWKEQWIAAGDRVFEPATYKTFTLLACAFAPISRRALLAALKRLGSFDGGQLDEALLRLRRFVVRSPDGFSVSHPELARWWYARVDNDGEAAPVDAAFVELGREMLSRPMDPDVQRYLLRTLFLHIRRLPNRSIEDIRLIAHLEWRSRNQDSDRWPADYRAGLDAMDALCLEMDEANARQGLPCPGLGCRLVIDLCRLSVDQLTRRVSAELAAELVRRGRWPPSHALDHVLLAYHDDFPRIAAIGTIAPVLGTSELASAMEQLALERDYGFNWDNSLGVWSVAAAATQNGGLDYTRIRQWAATLPGIGAAVALLGHAAACPADMRSDATAQALAALPDDPSATDRTLLSLGIRISSSFRVDEVASMLGTMPFALAHVLGFDEADPGHSASALRVCWPWLSAAERDAGVVRLQALLEANRLGAEPETGRFDFDYRDWVSAVGAIWDVCSTEQARRLFSLLWPIHRGAGRGIERRTAYTAAVQFASRLPASERESAYSKARLHGLAYDGVQNAPQIRTMFTAEALLPERHAELVELILEMRGNADVVDVLRATAHLLDDSYLKRLRAAAPTVPASLRDHYLRPVLSGLGARGADSADLAFAYADRVDDGMERLLLEVALQGLQGRSNGSLREEGSRALHALPSYSALRVEILAAVAPLLQPWTLEECMPWAAATGSREKALSYLLPHIEPAELDREDAPSLLAIRPAAVDEHSVAEALRRMFRRSSLEAVYTWVDSMAAESGDDKGEWLGLAIRSLSGELQTPLIDHAISVKAGLPRAITCAALMSHCSRTEDRERLWGYVEAEMHSAADDSNGGGLSQILRRLSPELVARAFDTVELDRKLLQRSAYSLEWLWLGNVLALMPWVPASLIDEEFVRGSTIVAQETGTDTDALRAALGPRLLELGRIELAMHCANRLREQTSVRAHVGMVPHLKDERFTLPFAEAILSSGMPEASAFAVARAVRRPESRVPRAVAYRLTCDLLAGAESEPQFFLLLLAHLSTILELAGPGAFESVSASLRR